MCIRDRDESDVRGIQDTTEYTRQSEGDTTKYASEGDTTNYARALTTSAWPRRYGYSRVPCRHPKLLRI